MNKYYDCDYHVNFFLQSPLCSGHMDQCHTDISLLSEHLSLYMDLHMQSTYIN